MRITTVITTKSRKKADVLVLPFWQGEKRAEPAFKARELFNTVRLPIEVGDFCGRAKELLFVYPAQLTEQRILLVGLGKQDALSYESLRLAYASALRAARRKKCKSMNILLPETTMAKPCLCRVISEGVLLANYTFTYTKIQKEGKTHEEKEPLVEALCFIGADKACLEEVQRCAKIISAVYLSRNLVNGSAQEVTAQVLARTAKEMAKEFSSIKTTVLGQKELEKEKMGLILAVNQGAAQEPALILLEYKGDPDSKDLTAIVGKGITFDTGGINLKPTGSIETMKNDMAGAATVLGTLRAAAELKLKKNVIGVIAAAENAISAKSFRPGDVFFSHSGKSVEISNTDAEGRLVLADALSYLQNKYPVSRIIDLATLTGAIVITLGEEVTGLFCNQSALAAELIAAGEKTFERLWRLPLYLEYKDALKSPIADMKNSGGRKAGSVTAALFLQQFIKDNTPWAHLDIAGTAYLTELNKPYYPAHGTGIGVRLLIEFLENSLSAQGVKTD